MNLNTKFNPDETVYVKTERNGVVKGRISAIAIDSTKQPQRFAFVYLVWVSDRKDNAGHHLWAYEQNIGRSFDEAYYDADSKLPWDIAEDMRWEHVSALISKAKSHDVWCPSVTPTE